MSTFGQLYLHCKANSKRYGKERTYGIGSSSTELLCPRGLSKEAGEAWEVALSLALQAEEPPDDHRAVSACTFFAQFCTLH